MVRPYLIVGLQVERCTRRLRCRLKRGRLVLGPPAAFEYGPALHAQIHGDIEVVF